MTTTTANHIDPRTTDVSRRTVAVDSTEGKGSRFTIRLPVAAKPQPNLPSPRPAESIGTARHAKDPVDTV